MSVAAAVSTSAAVDACRFSVRYVDSCGGASLALLSVSSQVGFESLAPVQPLRIKGRPGFAGLWWMATTGLHVGFESWRKRDQLIALDFDSRVEAVALRPLSLVFAADDELLEYCPDYFVRLRDGTGVVVDVVDDTALSRVPDFVPAAVNRAGWQYWTPAAVSPVRLANLRWLAGYRNPRCADEARVSSVIEAFAVAQSLAAGIAGLGDRIGVLPTLFHLLWRGVLVADLESRVLGDDTLVTARAWDGGNR